MVEEDSLVQLTQQDSLVKLTEQESLVLVHGVPPLKFLEQQKLYSKKRNKKER
jgi:hypothetical protein